MTFNRGDIVLIPFPFSNQTGIKKRPSVILSNIYYNNRSKDCIACGITSNLRNNAYSVMIEDKDMKDGSIKKTSLIKADHVFCLEQRIIIKKVGRVADDVVNKTVEELIKIIT